MSQSLQYKAPKEPTKSKAIQMHSDKATLFKYDRNNKSYITKGSVVASVIYSPDNAAYQFIVAFSQQNIATQIDISGNFSFKVQANSYCNYNDNEGNTWSLYFNNDQNAADTFSKYIAIAKCAADKYQNVITQTLIDGKGQPVVNGDNLGVFYTGWLIKSGKIDVVIDTNKGKSLKKLKLGDGKVIKGWELGLLGMLKGETRAIVIPPQFGYGQKGIGPIPGNSVLLFEVSLKKTKRSQREVQEVGGEIPEPTFEPSSSPNNKTSIVERMKRLGNNTLNVTQPTIDDEDDFPEDDDFSEPSLPIQESVTVYVPPPTEEKETENARLLREQMEKMKEQMEEMKRNQEKIEEEKKKKAEEEIRKQKELLEQQREQLEQQKLQQQLEQQQQLLKQQMQMQMQPIITQTSPVNNVQQYLEQSSFQKTISQVVDQVLKKVSFIEERIEKSFIGTQSEGTTTLTGPVLLKTIKKLVDENENMRKDLNEKTEKSEMLRERLNSLHEKNEQLIDENNNLLERKNDSMKEQQELIRKKMRSLINEKEEIESEYNSLQEKMANAKKKFLEMSKSYDKLKDELSLLREEKEKSRILIENLQSSRITNESKIETLSSDLKSEREAKKEALKQVQSLKDDLKEEQAEVERLKQSINERKEKHQEVIQRLQSLHEEEKNSLKREVDIIEKTLKEERQSSGSLTEEQIKKYEEREKDLLLQFSQQKTAAVELALKELKEKFEIEKKEIQNEYFLKGKSEGKNALNFSVESANNSSQVKIDHLEQQLKESIQKYNKLKSEMEKIGNGNSKSSSHISKEELKKIKKENNEETVATIKRIMNGVFQQAKSKFEDGETYESSQINSLLLGVIKEGTLNAVKKFEDDSEDSEEEEDSVDNKKQDSSSEEEEQVENNTPVKSQPQIEQNDNKENDKKEDEDWDEEDSKEDNNNNNSDKQDDSPPNPEDDIIIEEPSISRSIKVESEEQEEQIITTNTETENEGENEGENNEKVNEDENENNQEEEKTNNNETENKDDIIVEEPQKEEPQKEEPQKEEIQETKKPSSTFEDPFGVSGFDDNLFGSVSTSSNTTEKKEETKQETKVEVKVESKKIVDPLFGDDDFFNFDAPKKEEKKPVETKTTVVTSNNNKPLFEDDDFFNF